MMSQINWKATAEEEAEHGTWADFAAWLRWLSAQSEDMDDMLTNAGSPADAQLYGLFCDLCRERDEARQQVAVLEVAQLDKAEGQRDKAEQEVEQGNDESRDQAALTKETELLHWAAKIIDDDPTHTAGNWLFEYDRWKAEQGGEAIGKPEPLPELPDFTTLRQPFNNDLEKIDAWRGYITDLSKIDAWRGYITAAVNALRLEEARRLRAERGEQ